MNQELSVEVTKPSLGKFPISMKALGETQRGEHFIKRFEKVLPIIQTALDEGEILNTVLNDLKRSVNDFASEAITAHVDAKFLHAMQWQDQPEDLREISHPYEIRGLNAYIKRLNKLSASSKKTEMYKNAQEIAIELLSLYQIMEWLKAHMVRASDKKKEVAAAKKAESDAYQKKFTDHEDVQKVVAVLKKTASDIEDRLYNAQLVGLHAIVSQFQAAEITDYTQIFERDPHGMITMQSIVERTDNNHYRRGPKEFKLVKDWAIKLEQMARRTASDVIDHFVYKNSGKLSYVLFTKNNMKSVEIMNVKLGRGVVECDVHCTFDDGSEFTANNKVVFSFSKLNTPFYRYPTTFRNVMLPDGSRMSKPSEERMDTVFAITK